MHALKASPDLARALARIVIGRGGPRDLAAIRDGIFAAAEFAARLSALPQLPRDIAQAVAALRRPDAAHRRRACSGRWPTNCPLPPRRRLRARRLRGGARRSARAARRIPPRHRRAASALRRDDRHPRAENPAQQRARLFRRCLGAARREVDERAAQRDLHPSPDARPARCASPPPSSANSKPRSPMPPNARWRSNSKSSIASPQRVAAASAAIKEAANALARRSTSRRALAALAVERDYVRPEVDGSLAFAITGGRHPVVEQALRRDGGPFVANDCDLSPPPPPYPPGSGGGKRGPAASGSSPARTWRANRPSCARTR